MKKAVKIFVVVFIAVLLAGMLIACNKEPETITISFETNGGLEVPAVTINVGDDFEAPTPVRAGYIFKGWFVDESLSMPFDGAPTHNITLFAKWEANQNTIIFDANGGNGSMPNAIIATGETRNLPDCAFSKEGYVFVGWATTAEGEVAYGNQAPYTMGPESHYTLYAKWAVPIGVVFNGNGGTGSMASLTKGAGYPFTLPQNAFVKSGHIFAGWATTPDGDAVYADKGTMTAGTSDITLYAVWVNLDDVVDLSHIDDGYIIFGEYPQSLKSSNVNITETTDSRGYYLGSDDNYYAKVTATPNHSTRYDSMFGDAENYSMIIAGEVYYFKVEPIKWRILAQADGAYTLMADKILDTQIFDQESGYWHESYIRTWLNNDFFTKAFSALQRTLVQNSNIITKYDEYNDAFDVEFATSDYVFLPTLDDMTNVSYGFTKQMNGEQPLRQAFTTEFCRAKGVVVSTIAKDNNNYSAHFGKGFYLTRSHDTPERLYRVQYIGSIEQTTPWESSNGIRPMMILEIPA